MKKILIIFCCYFANVQAVEKTPGLNVIVITNFFCPYCWEAQEKLPGLVQAIQENIGSFELAPVAWGEASLWPSIVYFALPPELQAKAASIFYALAQNNGLAMASLGSTCEALTMALAEYSFSQCMQAENNKIALAKMQKSMALVSYLLEHYRVKKLPIFILEKNAAIIKVIARDDAAGANALIDLVKKAIKY